MWEESIKDDQPAMGGGGRNSRHHHHHGEYNKGGGVGSLLNQYGFGYIQKAKDQLKRKLIHAYEENNKPFEERADFKELQLLSMSSTKERKRDKKRKDKKKRKKRKKRSSSASSVSSPVGADDNHNQNTSDEQSKVTKANDEQYLLMTQSQFVSSKNLHGVEQ